MPLGERVPTHSRTLFKELCTLPSVYSGISQLSSNIENVIIRFQTWHRTFPPDDGEAIAPLSSMLGNGMFLGSLVVKVNVSPDRMGRTRGVKPSFSSRANQCPFGTVSKPSDDVGSVSKSIRLPMS